MLTPASSSGRGRGVRSGSGSSRSGPGLGTLIVRLPGSPGTAGFRGEICNQLVEFRQQQRVVLPRVGSEVGGPTLAVEQERLHSLLVQLRPPRAVAGLIEIVGVEDLLELALDRNRQVGLT